MNHPPLKSIPRFPLKYEENGPVIELICATLTGASRTSPNAREWPSGYAAPVNFVVHSVLANRNVGGTEVQVLGRTGKSV